MEIHQKFLNFNGKNIVFLTKDGKYWIALKPICEALNLDANRCYKNIKKDPILEPALAILPMQVDKNGKSQIRNVTCIPEKFIYGWLFSINSDSEELIEYKRTCYDLLYNHFHGVISNRKELLLERNEIDEQIHQLKEHLKTSDIQYKKLEQLQLDKRKINKELGFIDKKIVKQPELF